MFCRISLYHQVLRKWNIDDEIKILRLLIVEIKKFHDKDKVIGNINPFNVKILDEQVTILPKPEINSDWEWSYHSPRNTKDTDIYLLGCVFYFILTRGQNPFGDRSNNKLKAKNLFDLKACRNIQAQKLIGRMINFDHNKRPTIEDVCNHPMFWEPNHIVPFLKEDVTEDPQLTDEYHPIAIRGDLLMASYRFGFLKLERKAEQIQIRPGRYGNDYVNVIIASKSRDEKLIHYWTSLSQLSFENDNVLRLFDVHRDEFNIW
jgi:serine/threonine protein kinase